MEPLISVIVPVYNSEMYIIKCIESLLEQTFENFEILIINDGSTDNSRCILKSKYSDNKKIKIFNLENQGVSHARNYGLKRARGKYIAFVDSDDYCEPEYLKVMYENLKSDDLVICNFQSYDIKNMKIKLNTIQSGKFKYMELMKEFWKFRDYGVFNCNWNKLYKKEIIKKYNIAFQEKQYMGEDAIFNFQYMSKCNVINILDNPLYTYVFHPMQTVSKNTLNYFDNILFLFYYIKKVLKEAGVFEKEEKEYYLRLYQEIKGGIVKVSKSNTKFRYRYSKIKEILVSIDTRTTLDFIDRKDIFFYLVKYKQTIVLCLLLKIYYFFRKDS